MKEYTYEKVKPIIASILTAAFVLFAIMAFSQLAHASKDDGANAGGGGKVESWQTTGELPTAHLPLTLDLETCTLLFETDREKIYECVSFVFGTFTVTDPK